MNSFRKAYIAHTVKYTNIELLLMLQTVKYNHKDFLKNNNSGSYPYYDEPYTLGKGEYSYNNFAVAYSIGTQRILSDKFVLDYGIRFAYTPTYNIIVLASDTYNITDYYQKVSRGRTFRHQAVNFFLGIGFLAF